LLGFNTNVRHKGKVFHIQTEDSGVKHPHVITHLFADGGRILKSTKTSYGDHLAEDNLTDTVRTMMKDQHKAMFMALRDGTFDAVIEDPGPQASSAEGRSFSGPPAKATIPTAPVASTSPAAPPKPSHPEASVPPVAVLPVIIPGPPPMAVDLDAAASWKGVRVEMDVLERAASASVDEPGLFHPAGDMPPPPAAVLSSKRPTGSYRALTPEPSGVTDSPSRYVPSRPAAIFATARPTEGGNVFGEEMISDKSLDEVILSFLAEEFGTAPGGKPDGGKR
jgi:hypothetical protein